MHAGRLQLATEIARFVAGARQSPATAVDPAELERLERAARAERHGCYIAQQAPVAPYRWMSRVVLSRTQEDSVTDSQPLGEPGEIVGLVPKLVVRGDGTTTLPPLEAIDVAIETRRKEEYTHRLEGQFGPSTRFVNLPMISALLALRPLQIPLDVNNDPNITFQYRWAVPVVQVAAENWGDVQISLGILWRPLERRR